MLSMYCRPAVGGIERTVFDLSRRLVERGHAVTVWASDRVSPTKPKSILASVDSASGVSIRRWPSILFPRLPQTIGFFVPGMMLSTRKMLREYDVVHSHGLSAFSSYGVMFKAGRSLVPWIVSPYASVDGSMFRLLYNRTIGSAILSRVKYVVCMTSREAAYFVSMGVPSSKVVIAPSGVDISRFEYSGLYTDPNLSHRFDERRFVLYLGRLSRNKGIDVLLEASSVVFQHDGTVCLVIAGEDAGEFSRLRQRCTTLGLADRVFFLGGVTDQQATWLLRHAVVVVLPSRYGEAEGLVLVEAMAAGSPVIATRVGGIPDVVQDGVNGILVEPGSTGQLVDAMLKVLRDPSLRDRMRMSNPARAKAFSWTEIVGRMEEVYAKAILGS